MNWWEIIISAVILWFIGGLILKYGLSITRLTYKKKNSEELMQYSSAVGDSSIFGMVSGLLFSFSLGLLTKFSPWWLIKFFVITFACLFFYLGIWAVTKI
jgi:hypothetical protein